MMCNLRWFLLKLFCSFVDRTRVFCRFFSPVLPRLSADYRHNLLRRLPRPGDSRKGRTPVSSTLALNGRTFYQLPLDGAVPSTCHYLT